MAYRLLKTSELSSVPVGYSLETADLFQFTVGTQTAGPSLSTVKLEVGELMAWSVTPSNTYSLWVSGTDDNVYNRSGGNVGIGTTSNPEVKLTVSGPISSRGEGTFEGGLSAKSGKSYFSGDVGIGTAVPAAGLHVKTTGSEMVRLESPTGNNDIGIDFYRGTDHKWQIRNNGNDDKFFIIPASSSDGDTAFTITSVGLVGIGTTEPDATLTVHDRLNSILGRFQRNDSSDYVTGVRINALNGATHTYADICVDPAEQRAGLGVGTSSAGLPIDKTDLSKAKIVWDTSGNVGVGTEDPAAKLEIEDGGTSHNCIVKITADDQSPWGLIVGNDTYSTTDTKGLGLFQSNDGKSYIYSDYDSSNGTLILQGTGGKVGIGTDEPSAHLHVKYAGGSTDGVLVDSSASGNRAKLCVKDNDTLGYFISEDDHISIGGNDSLAAGNLNIAEATGNVGIGTTAPGQKLSINTTSGNGLLGFDIDGDQKAYVGVSKSAGSPITGMSSGDLGIRVNGGAFYVSVDTGSTSAFSIASNGESSFAKDATFNGDNVNINGGGTLNMTASDYAAVEMRGPDGAYIDFKTDGSNYLHRIVGYASSMRINTLSEHGLYLQCTETDSDDTLQTYIRLHPSPTTDKKDGLVEVWKTLDFSDTDYWSANGAYQPVIQVGTELGKQICTNLNADMLDGNHATAFGSSLGSTGSEAEASKNWKLRLLGSDSSVKSTISIKYAEVANKAYSVSFNNGLTTGSAVQFVKIGVGAENTTGGNGSIVATGDIVGFSTSDRRFKTKIKPISNSLDILKNINGVEFEWNNKQELYKGRDVGVIAQELEQAIGLENVVKTRDDGYKAVRYEKLIPVLIEAVKTLSERVETLEKGQHGKI